MTQQCEVGLYQDYNLGPNGGHNWEALPLGADNKDLTKDQKCVNLNEVSDTLSRNVNSYTVTGWCDCSFYSNENCNDSDFIFNAYNRQDTDLKQHGHNDNKVASYKCKSTNHTETFVSGTLMLSNGGTSMDDEAYSTNQVISKALFNASESGQPGRTDSGNAGVTDVDGAFLYQNSDPSQRVASWRCWLPFGIKWSPLPNQDVNA
ncbi:hypothetical protein AA313_de0201240 [Arthrobotrys entomopaga]|nr:hypothetical protein AA313_de0201240 [Arthrobotrys entomopaga]